MVTKTALTGEIQEKLILLRDEGYRDFQSKLMPTIDRETVIGVRTPEVRRLSKEYSKNPQIDEFLSELPHKYYEENNIHGFIIEQFKDYERCVKELDRFLPYIDNWATCDVISPKIFKKHTDELFIKIREWIASDKTYTIRFGINMLMSFYLDEGYKTEYSEMVASVRSEEYYVNMMIAWYFATALAKQYNDTVTFIENRRLDVWTHNKTIQKACESYRINDDRKAYLRTLKLKK